MPPGRWTWPGGRPAPELRPARTWRAFLERAAATDCHLYYETEGHGPPLLLVHGFAMHQATWRHWRGPLARTHRLWLVDLKGCGRSPAPADGAYGIYDHAAALAGFIAHHRLSHLTLVGHSLGGALSLILARYYRERGEPERVTRLVLVGAAAFRQPIPAFMRVLRVPGLAELCQPLVPARWAVARVLRRLYARPERIPPESVKCYSEPMERPGVRRALIETARQVVPADLEAMTARYREIAQPALCLWGMQDRIVPVEIGRRLARALPRARLVTLDDCGHLPQEECPGPALAALEGFLAGADW